MATSLASGKTATKADLIDAIKQAQAQQNIKNFVSHLHGLCFDRCITAPGSSLSRSDEACVSNCVRKYMALHDTVSKEWNSSIQRLQSQQGS